jgi:hypothetical protein
MNDMIFAYRVLQKSGGRSCLVRIFAPIEEEMNWSCRVMIEGDELVQNTAHGADSLQALSAAFLMLVGELRFIEAMNPKAYTWEGQECLTLGLGGWPNANAEKK